MRVGKLCTMSIHVITSSTSVFGEVYFGVIKAPCPSTRWWGVSFFSSNLRRASAASRLLRKTRGILSFKNECGPRMGTGLRTGERPGTGVTG